MKSSFVQRLVNAVFGFDFFISYGWRDGEQYAAQLYEKLSNQGFTVFLDQQVFVCGDNWSFTAKLAVRRTKQLILVATPAIHESEAVLEEVETFIRTGRRIIPIELGEGLNRHRFEKSAILNAIDPRVIKLSLDNGNEIPDSPTSEIVAELRRGFTHLRQNQLRIRFLSATVIALIALLSAVGWFARSAYKNLKIAEFNEGEMKKQAKNVSSVLDILSSDLQQKAQSGTGLQTLEGVAEAMIGSFKARKEVDPETLDLPYFEKRIPFMLAISGVWTTNPPEGRKDLMLDLAETAFEACLLAVKKAPENDVKFIRYTFEILNRIGGLRSLLPGHENVKVCHNLYLKAMPLLPLLRAKHGLSVIDYYTIVRFLRLTAEAEEMLGLQDEQFADLAAERWMDVISVCQQALDFTDSVEARQNFTKWLEQAKVKAEQRRTKVH